MIDTKTFTGLLNRDESMNFNNTKNPRIPRMIPSLNQTLAGET